MEKYKDIFGKIENSLREQSTLSKTEFDKEFGRFKKFENKKRTDNEIFRLLTMIVFYSGFRSSTVEKKEKIILGHFPDYITVSKYSDKDFNNIISDTNMIRNKNKIRGCINNAVKFKSIVEKHGSFQNYLDSFNIDESFENLILLKESLCNFSFIGETTVYHLLGDLGYNVIKPDRVILRIFKRLGLIENDERLGTIIQGQKFSIETGYPIRYIDIIIVKYGQLGESIEFGLKNGICLEKNPNCDICDIQSYCNFI
jgi:DNA-3-methyladenine glycosylase I